MRAELLGEPGSVQFFSAGLDVEGLRREVFFLAYYLHWSWEELMSLDIAERRAYVHLLVEQIERENERVEDARRR